MNSMREIVLSFIMLGALLWLGSTQALAADQSSDLFPMGEVVVSEAGSGVEAVSTVTTIDAKTISERGARTLDEALQLVPGLYVRGGADGTPRIDIRGFRTRHVLLLLDGIPLNSTFDGQFDPAAIPVENIAAIKVTTGGSSLLYGTGGNGGVINIITKKGTMGLHGSVGAEAGSEDTYLGKATLGGANDKVDAFVSGSSYKRHAFPLSDDFSATAAQDGDERVNSDRKRDHLFANAGIALSPQTQLGLTLNYEKGEYGKPPVTNYDKNDTFTKKPKYERIDDQEGYAAQLSFDHATNGPLSLRGWVYYNRLDELENRYDDANYSAQIKKGAYHSDTRNDVSGISLQFKGDWQAAGTTTLALSAQNDRWEANGFELVKDGVRAAIDDERELQTYYAALEYEVQPIKNLGLVVGYGQQIQERDGDDSDDDYSYLIGAYYDLTATTRLKASHSRKIRFPSVKQLYEAGSGNENLKAERTLHYEAGVEQTLPFATKLTLNGYLIDAKDFIEKDFEGINANFEEYRFQGFELIAENRQVENLLLRASYAYLDAKDRSAGSAKDELQYRPEDTVTLEANYHFSFGLNANATLLYVADQYYYDSTGTEQAQLDSYTVVNLKLTQQLLDKNLDLYVGADNLFDKDYEQSYGFPQPGRTLYGGVEYRF